MFALSSCAALDVVKSYLGSKAQDGISIDAQIGDRENELQAGGARGAGKIEAKGRSQVHVTTSQAGAKIGKAEVVKVQNTPPWVVLLLILGWVCPTPRQMFKSIIGCKIWRRTTPPQT